MDLARTLLRLQQANAVECAQKTTAFGSRHAFAIASLDNKALSSVVNNNSDELTHSDAPILVAP